MNKFIFIGICICLFNMACSSLDWNGYRKLGEHYFLWEGDHYRYDIIWCKSESDTQGGGVLLTGLNEQVTKYSYNDRYIIFKTIEYKSSNHSISGFWLVDKTAPIGDGPNWKTAVLSGPLDSVSLVQCLRQKRIGLKVSEMQAPR